MIITKCELTEEIAAAIDPRDHPFLTLSVHGQKLRAAAARLREQEAEIARLREQVAGLSARNAAGDALDAIAEYT